eukprot:TRINITY_DN2165_c0_g1_i3.p1 TRINITY_DN2165_c0_g1~~TRINITY_DN2165_c0_g1_i3.p1  ORF type:complete len:527 (+),score=133.99 TRINITY_DN2165_c0_g1_i3:443-2023(+)
MASSSVQQPSSSPLHHTLAGSAPAFTHTQQKLKPLPPIPPGKSPRRPTIDSPISSSTQSLLSPTANTNNDNPPHTPTTPTNHINNNNSEKDKGLSSSSSVLSLSPRSSPNVSQSIQKDNSNKKKYENFAFDVHWWEHDPLYGFEPAPKNDPEARRREKEWVQNLQHKKMEVLEEWRAYEAQHTGKEPPAISSSSKYELDNSDDEEDGEFDKPWSKVITSKALSMVTNIAYPTLKKIIRKGIPAHKRAKIWMERSGALAKKQQEGEDIYERLVEISPENSPIREEIEMDIARTFSTHLLFAVRKTKDMMLRILLAYSVRNPKLGYCQNMTCIVGILLFFLNEIDTFWTFTTIMEEILPVDFCSPTLIGLRVDQKVLDVLIEERLPKLHAHFIAHHMELSCFTTAWLLRLFVDVFPIETTLRIWDCFLNEGSKILFRVALAFLKLNEEGIRSITQAGDLLMFLNQESKRFYDADKLIKTSYGFWMLRRSRINELREKFIQEVLTMDEAISAPSPHKVIDDDFVVLEDS